MPILRRAISRPHISSGLASSLRLLKSVAARVSGRRFSRLQRGSNLGYRRCSSQQSVSSILRRFEPRQDWFWPPQIWKRRLPYDRPILMYLLIGHSANLDYLLEEARAVSGQANQRDETRNPSSSSSTP